MFPGYNIGTASLTNGSADMVGVGTLWAGNVRPNDIVIGYFGETAIVASVNSNTSITLTRPFRGQSQSTAFPYEILYTSDDVFAQALGREVLQKITGSALMGLTAAVAAPRKGVRFDATSAASLFDLSDKAVALLGQVDEAAMRSFLQVAKKQADALDATEGAGLVVGAFGLGGTNGLQGAGADIAALTRTQIINALDALPAGWDSALGTYPMGMHWQRSAVVQAQFAIGYNGEAGFRNTAGAGWQAWRRLYHTRNILAPVALSGGVPTGGIMNRGSNGNGGYVRFADGTQIATQSISVGAVTTPQGALYSGASPTTWIFPAAFIDSPIVAGLDGSSYNVFIMAGSSGANQVELMPFSWTSIGSSRTARVVAIGRWN